MASVIDVTPQNYRALCDVISGAKHCIASKNCDGSCPYYSRRKQKCSGDYRKDLLKWVILLRSELSRVQRPKTDEDIVETADFSEQGGQ